MQVLENVYFFENYSLQTIIISVIVATISLIVNNFFRDKLSAVLLSFLPFAIGILLNFAYMLIAVGIKSIVIQDILSTGILCGSLSLCVTSFIKKIADGKHTELSALTEVIERTLGEHLVQHSLSIAVMEIKNQLVNGLTGDANDEQLEKEIVDIIKKYQEKELGDEQVLALAKLVISAVKQLLQTK